MGYVVSIEPEPSAIPFSVAGYRPDILATRGAETIIVEVKSKKARRALEHYKHVLDAVRQHPGWRFMLSTVDDAQSPSTEEPRSIVKSKSVDDLVARLEPLVKGGNHDLAFPFLWNAYIACIAAIVAKEGLAVSEYSDLSIINYAYSLGTLSNEQYEESKRFLQLRNGLVHNVHQAITVADATSMLELLKGKLADLKQSEASQP